MLPVRGGAFCGRELWFRFVVAIHFSIIYRVWGYQAYISEHQYVLLAISSHGVEQGAAGAEAVTVHSFGAG